jgi:trimeric autotransporter adhesin
MKHTLLILCAVALLSHPAGPLMAAPLGTAFTYQGTLSDHGNAANGCYDLSFTVYDSATEPGVVAGPVTNLMVGVTNGLFTTAIDFGQGVFGGDARWLELGVRSNGLAAGFSVLSPRQPLTAAPYARYAPAAGTATTAASATTAGAVTGTIQASQLSGSIASSNIAPGSITSAMLANGAVGSAQLAAGAVTSAAVADGAITLAHLATAASWFGSTLTNPAPAGRDGFGYAVAALSNDRLVVGAPRASRNGFEEAGAAYLFDNAGGLITTFAKPSPAAYDWLGSSLAAVGSDHVLIGAEWESNAGAAYLFDTQGTLVTTFLNPGNRQFFGSAVAALGNDRVLIGASGDENGDIPGAVYLYSTNGTLLRTFSDAAQTGGDWFGWSVTVVGSDRVLIGAPGAQAAYLFSTAGELVQTFTDPTPVADGFFGAAVAAVGSDAVLIGAPGIAWWGFNRPGLAYLFSTNGTLLATFVSPTPSVGDSFGASLAVAGTDVVLIGAPYDATQGAYAGAAFLFKTDGTLLRTLPKSDAAAGDQYGSSVAALGVNHLVVGAPYDGAGTVCASSYQVLYPGVVAEMVAAGSVTSSSLANGAVTAAKLDPGIGVWSAANTNVYRPTGNVGIGTNQPQQKLHVIGNILASGTITPNSDRNAKTGFAPVDTVSVLEKVCTLPLQQWRFLVEPAEVKHLGPMAQDFSAAFGLGELPSAIATVDADGVALAAIQGLNQKIETMSRESEDSRRKLEAANAALRKEVEELKAALQRLAARPRAEEH